MRRINIFFLSILMILVFTFDTIYAKALIDEADKLSQIKEIRQSIKNNLRANEKIENQIDRKSRQIEKVLVKLSKSNMVSQKVIDEQVNPKLEGIMTQLMQIGEYESSSWENLKKGNNQIRSKKYSIGIKYLKQADADLKNKYNKMVDFKSDLDSFFIFINSLQYK